MATNEERPKSQLSKMVTAVKWCAKWAATAGGVYFVIHMPRQIQFVQIISIVFCILCCFILIIFSHAKRIRIIRIIPRVFMSIFIIGMSLLIFVYITITYYPTIGSKVASGLTKEKILSLNLGMDKKNVIRILGKPIAEEHNDYYGDRIYYAVSSLYGEGFDFYLNYDKKARIYYIFIERNDEFVYKCSSDECPVIYNQKKFNEFISLSPK